MSGRFWSTGKERRFSFGANWKGFLNTLDETRVSEAVGSLQRLLDTRELWNKTFLDVGCGSGLPSLAARRLGAAVHSFDCDPQCVRCTKTLKERYFRDDRSWTIEEGSVLDKGYMKSLGLFDIVYSWGVLHHTGNMMVALSNVAIPVKEKGLLCVAIYNDQGLVSKMWGSVKQSYCSSLYGKLFLRCLFLPVFGAEAVILGIIKHGNPIRYFTNYKKRRGMSLYFDWIDWLGGYPFEVSKPERISRFYMDAGFRVSNMITTNGAGCNQFVFERLCSGG